MRVVTTVVASEVAFGESKKDAETAAAGFAPSDNDEFTPMAPSDDLPF